METENIKQDTANKILEGVIKDYTGKTAKLDYTIKDATVVQEYGAKSSEFQAREAIAANIIKLEEEGKLKEKSLAEIEQLLLQNAKTREETRNIVKSLDLLDENIKGKKLENVLSDLDVKLMQETGLGKDSPYWLKIAGRLLMELMDIQ